MTTKYTHIQHLVDEFSVVTEELSRHSLGWFRVSCDRCDWYATGTENYMDEWAWNHMRDFHVGRIRLMKCAGSKLPAGVRVRTAYGWNNPETWWAITPNGVAHSFGTHGPTLSLVQYWLKNFRNDVDFWDPTHTPEQ